MLTKTTQRMILVVFCTAFMLGVSHRASCGQNPETPKPSTSNQPTIDLESAAFGKLISDIKKGKRAAKTEEQKNVANALVTDSLNPYMIMLAGPTLQGTFLSTVQEWRTDGQTEGPTSSAGTTSLVSKGSVPALLGLAVENGALTQTTSGTSVTFRTNPTGLINALQKHGYVESGPDSYTDPVIKFVRKASAAVTFNTSGTGNGSQGGTFAGSAQQVSSFEFRYDIVNHRDPRDQRYAKTWQGLVSDSGQNLADKVHEFQEQLEGIKPPDENRKKKFEDWRNKVLPWMASASADVSVSDADPNSVQSVVYQIADDFIKEFGDDPVIKSAAVAAGQAFSDYLNVSGKIRSKISRSPIVTFDYTDTRQGTMATMMSMASGSVSPATPGVKPPDLSNFKLIIVGGTAGGATLTANASLTLFNSNPQAPEKGRVRDFQLSGQVDIPLREIQNIGVPTLTFSGLFLSLRQQPLGMPVQVNGVNVNLKGNIGFAQAKISFPMKKGSGVNIPLSITYASRTELNKEHDIRGSIGMTFNLDSIFASSK